MKKWIGMLAPCLAALACTFDESQLRPAKGTMPALDAGTDMARVVDARPVAVDMAQVADRQPLPADVGSVLCPAGTYTTESCGTAQCFFALLGATTVGPCLYVTPETELGVWYVPDCARCPSGVDAASMDTRTAVPDAVPMAPDAAPAVDLVPVGVPDAPPVVDLAQVVDARPVPPDAMSADALARDVARLDDAGRLLCPDLPVNSYTSVSCGIYVGALTCYQAGIGDAAVAAPCLRVFESGVNRWYVPTCADCLTVRP